MSAPTTARLNQLDALRGLAAMAVVMYHFSTRFGQIYPQAAQPSWAFAHGYFGVNLFFIISGFVIFMTVARSDLPADFVVSRFSRLYPAFWTAVALTFALTHLLGLPGKTVPLTTALANSLMFHGFFGVAHVDGVYWTLEVELIFYAMTLLLLVSRQLARIHLLLLALLTLRLVYYGAAVLLHRDLPWVVSRFLILQNIPWFALGICVYQATRPAVVHALTRWTITTAAVALLSLALVDGAAIALLALVFASVVLLAARGQLGLLNGRLFVWLGAISYPLYLLHENIGWALILKLGAWGWPVDMAVATAMLLVLALSDTVSRWVERPGMRWIRKRYRQHAAKAVVSQA